MTGFNSKREAAADKLQEPVSEALKLALEVMQINLRLLEKVDPHEDQEDLLSESIDLTHKAITKCEEALAQPPLPVQPTDSRCVGCDLVNGCPEFCKCIPPLPVQPVQEPVAYVTGMSFGRFIVEPLNPAMVLPVGMALYSAPQENI